MMDEAGREERRSGAGVDIFDGGGSRIQEDGGSGAGGNYGAVGPADVVQIGSAAGSDAARVFAHGEDGGCGSFVSPESSMAEVDGVEGTRVAEMEIDLVSDVENLSNLQGEDEVEGQANWRWNHVFAEGDMVWGKVKSHPWWPGIIFNETFATGTVRRTRREGYILVAFFGDSSYGWFDPAELVPFESHFAEKSRQTTQKSFVKAVDEAVDEASRRQTLGLVCNCNNRVRLRPTVDGYFAVDVDGNEAGLTCSERQIMRARSQFKPREAVSFAQELALDPHNCDRGSIDWVINMASILAYRKAAFEEFDETYAEAFGMEPARHPADAVGKIESAEKVPFRAPLSGPLVIAETLGEKKSYVKPRKVKESLKKDKYLLKRRDDANVKGLVQSNIHVSDYVLQKRDSAVVKTPDVTNSSETSEMAGNGSEVFKFEAADNVQNRDTYTVGGVNGQKHQHLSEVPFQTELMDEKLMSEKCDMQVKSPLQSEIVDKIFDVSGVADVRQRSGEDDYVHGKPVLYSSLKTTKPITPSTEGMNGEISFDHQDKKKKKKKKKQELESDVGAERSLKHPKTTHAKLLKAKEKFVEISYADKTLVQSDSKREDYSGISSISTSAPLLPTPDLSYMQLPVLIEDLQALAVDPYNGPDYINTSILRYVVLRFRSLVYQKSLVLQQSSDMELEESVSKSTQDLIELRTAMDVQDSHLSKLSKHISRPVDPTKAGRKRAPSDRQEEKSAKRLKKINELKASTNEKKLGISKEMEVQKVEKKDVSSDVTPVKPLIKSAGKHPKSADFSPKFQARTAEPTSLVLKFPQGATLPSVPQLKARFGRFGPLDLNGMRLYWKSYTCRVVYKHKGDALAAYNYALRNNNLFGPVRVTCQLKEYEAPPADSKRKSDEGADEAVASLKSSNLDPSSEPRPLLQPPRAPVQLKSCLKKPTSEDGGTGTGTGTSLAKESPRVKFMLGDEEGNSSRLEQTAVNNSIGPVGNGVNELPSSTSKNMNFLSSSNMISAPRPPISLPPPFLIRPEHATSLPATSSASASGSSGAGRPGFDQSRNRFQTFLNEMEGRREVDISQQMLSLMLRCSDIVSNVKCSVGYAPYRPL